MNEAPICNERLYIISRRNSDRAIPMTTITTNEIAKSTAPTILSDDMATMDDADNNLDAILFKIGQFDRFQIFILILISVPMMFNAIFSVTYVFTASAVAHRCYISECDTAESNFKETWTQWSIPNKTNDLDQCHRFASRFANNNQTNNNDTCDAKYFDRDVTEKCAKGNFVYRDKEITIANEFGIQCEDEWKLSLVGTINNVGQFFGIPLGGFISDRYGRKTSLALGGFLAGFIGTIRSFSPNYIFFLVFEFLDTLLSGTLYSTCFIVGIELVGPKSRVLVCCLITIFYAVGEILLAVIAKYYQNWRIILRIVYIPAILQFVFFWILPESVRWLLSQGKEEHAKQILRRAAAVNKRRLSEHSLEKLVLHNRNQMLKSKEDKFPIKEAFFKLHWRIINCSFCWIINVLVYYGISLNSVLLDGDKYVNFMLIALVEIPGFLLPYVLMDRIGRRYSLCSTMIICGLCCFATIFLTSDAFYIQLLLFLVGKLFITTSFQVLYFFTSEIFPTVLRNSLLSFCSMMGRFGSMLAPQTPLLANYNKHAPALLFSVTAIISGLLALFFPETTNLVLPSTMKEAHDIKTKSKTTSKS